MLKILDFHQQQMLTDENKEVLINTCDYSFFLSFFLLYIPQMTQNSYYWRRPVYKSHEKLFWYSQCSRPSVLKIFYSSKISQFQWTIWENIHTCYFEGVQFFCGVFNQMATEKSDYLTPVHMGCLKLVIHTLVHTNLICTQDKHKHIWFLFYFL